MRAGGAGWGREVNREGTRIEANKAGGGKWGEPGGTQSAVPVGLNINSMRKLSETKEAGCWVNLTTIAKKTKEGTSGEQLNMNRWNRNPLKNGDLIGLRRLRAALLFVVIHSSSFTLYAASSHNYHLGDLDEDGVVTVRSSASASGERDVATTRDTILHFTVPLSLTATLDTTQFYAEFAGQRPLSRVEISSDRKKATLFYQQPHPANSRLKITFDAPALTDLLGSPFDVDGDGLPGGALRLSFDITFTSKVGITGMIGRVMGATDNAGRPAVPFPIVGATITLDGAEQDNRTIAAADGTFTPSLCPRDAFFVRIDRDSAHVRRPFASLRP